MWDLEYLKYYPVWCKHATIRPWLIKPNSIDRLNLNAAYLKALQLVQSPLRPEDIVFNIHQLQRHELEIENLSPEESLYQLGIISIGTQAGSFINKKEFFDFFKQATVLLASEKFSLPGVVYSGSSRHALLYDVQLKGIGRNSMVSDFNYDHSNGVLTSFDAFKALVSGLVINSRTQLPELECLGIFNYTDHNSEGLPNAMLVRSTDSYRLAHCWPSQLNFHEMDIIKKHLSYRFNASSPDQIFSTIIENYIHAFSVGVLHRSPSLDNLLVDGRWIDAESLDFTSTKEAYPAFIQLFLPDQNNNDKAELIFNDGDFILDLVNTGLDFQFFGSWVHQLKYACVAHYKFLEELYEIKLSDFDIVFEQILNKYISNDLAFWFKLSKDYPSCSEILSHFSKKGELISFHEKDNPVFNDFALQGHFYDSLLKGWILYFSPKEDPHSKCFNMINRLYRMYPPTGDAWSHAISHYEQLEETVSRVFL